MKSLLITTSAVAILISCAANSDGVKRTDSRNMSTSTLQGSTTLIITSNPDFTPPSKGQVFDTVIELCDLAFNYLKCEEDCFSSEETLEKCVDEAKEIGITA